MRIGIFDPYLDDLGGGEKYMMTIAEVLSEKHQVDVFWDNKSDLDLLLSRFSLNLSKVKVVPNIFSAKFSTLRRFMASRKYDQIIILSDGSLPIISSKLLVHIQQPLNQMQTSSLIGRIKLKRVEVFFCNSNYTKSFIDNKFHIKTKILYPPVSIQPIHLKKENIILHVGRFRIKNIKNDDYKKQRIMVDQFKKMIDHGLKNWKFVLAISLNDKDKNQFDEIKNAARGYPVEFLINRSNDDLWEIYSKAKIYWHASGYGEDLNKNPEYAEHFGISTVEAMGAGAVPVVINAGGQKEIVIDEENGFLWDSLEDLESKTFKLIKNEDIWRKFSENARKRATIFSKDSFSEKLNQLIND